MYVLYIVHIAAFTKPALKVRFEQQAIINVAISTWRKQLTTTHVHATCKSTHTDIISSNTLRIILTGPGYLKQHEMEGKLDLNAMYMHTL